MQQRIIINDARDIKYNDDSWVNHKLYNSVELILRGVSHFTDIPIESLKGNSRKQEIVSARHIAFWLSCREKRTHVYKRRFKKDIVSLIQYPHTDATIKNVGAIIGNRHHTTVLHGRDRVQSLIDRNDNEPVYLSNYEKNIVDLCFKLDSKLTQAKYKYEKLIKDGEVFPLRITKYKKGGKNRRSDSKLVYDR